MIFTATKLKDAFIIEPERREDHRGFFARTWCQQELTAHGLNPHVLQCNISFNNYKGTLRGMHYQASPHEEDKLVRCTMGSIYDVIVDIRPESPTFKQYTSIVLTAENRRMLFIPKGFAHGFQTMEDNAEIFYQMSEFYAPDYTRGIRWNDPAFGIQWPADERIILQRDQAYPDFSCKELQTRGHC